MRDFGHLEGKQEERLGYSEEAPEPLLITIARFMERKCPPVKSIFKT
jgi:hypothetical protein